MFPFYVSSLSGREARLFSNGTSEQAMTQHRPETAFDFLWDSISLSKVNLVAIRFSDDASTAQIDPFAFLKQLH